jgi:hypothetical protein
MSNSIEKGSGDSDNGKILGICDRIDLDVEQVKGKRSTNHNWYKLVSTL